MHCFKLIYICLGMICLIILHSCRRKIDVNLPSKVGEPVVQSLYNNLKPIQLFVTHTSSPLDTMYKNFDTSALILLYENNNFIEVLKSHASGGYFVSNYIPQPGNLYKIEMRRNASVQNLVVLLNQLPAPVPLSKPVFKDSVVRLGQDYYGEISLDINDAPGYDIYSLKVSYYNSSLLSYIPIQFTTRDVVLGDDSTKIENNEYTFSDGLFRNTTHTFKILIKSGSYYNQFGRNNLLIETRLLSQDYWRYTSSLNAYMGTYNARNPLNNPVDLYSNSSNGFGIWAGYTVKFDTIY